MVLDDRPFRILCGRAHVFCFQIREEINSGLNVGCWLSRSPESPMMLDVEHLSNLWMKSPHLMAIADHQLPQPACPTPSRAPTGSTATTLPSFDVSLSHHLHQQTAVNHIYPHAKHRQSTNHHRSHLCSASGQLCWGWGVDVLSRPSKTLLEDNLGRRNSLTTRQS